MCEFEPIEEYEIRIGRAADKHFEAGQEYQSREIQEFAREHKSIFTNPMAHTYNRWNIGMRHGRPRIERILPLFEDVDGKYVFVGSRLSKAGKRYSGKVWHFPNQGQIQIGEWIDGCFTWIKGREL